MSPSNQVETDAAAFPVLAKFAASRQKTVTVFDLESTTNIPYVKWFGIIEIGLLHIFPNGRASTVRSFVNPERRISAKATDITGITNDDVRAQPTWAAWCEYMDDIARSNITAGYCSFGFDCPAVIGQNERYGKVGTEFVEHIDVFSLPGVTGKLVDAAKAYGISSETYHRALADVIVTAKLMNRVGEQHGLKIFEDHIGKRANLGSNSPRKAREAEILNYFNEHDDLPDLNELSERYGIKRTTVEGDVFRLIEKGSLPAQTLEIEAVQDWIQSKLESAIADVWQGDQAGRLKPLKEALEIGAPRGFDYTQLKLALLQRERQ